MLQILFWILKSAGILAIFHYLIPTIVHTNTRNHWIKVPIMFIFSILAGITMAWMNYMPYIIVFIWLGFEKYTLQAMREPKFEMEAGMRINKPLFYITSYAYIILSCLFAWLFQMEIILDGNQSGEGILLWKYILGIV